MFIDVTPCVGVWIETITLYQHSEPELSHPAWVCGLKLKRYHSDMTLAESHPAWVCGLKLCCKRFSVIQILSHPAWVCGLKQRQQVLF